jgi:Protein of Unknown function (DUF2784)
MITGARSSQGDATVVVHAGFVVFVVLGGLLALRWRRIVWLHLPAAAWGIAVEFAGWICPLTPLENALRERAGIAPYHGDFIEQHVVPLLYPDRLTRGTQFLLGSLALAINAFVYWRIAVRGSRMTRRGGTEFGRHPFQRRDQWRLKN